MDNGPFKKQPVFRPKNCLNCIRAVLFRRTALKACNLYLTLCLLLLCIPASGSRTGSLYQLDIYNGLPANHVYSAITDQNGYLWLCTTNGVVRYNGYELKTFGFPEGLPTSDVWGLHLDRKGRIWLRCYAGRMGYIYRNRYHSVYLKTTDRSFYPRHIADYGSGIIFFTSRQQGQTVRVLGIEKNDTVIFPAMYRGNEADVTDDSSFIHYELNGHISLSRVDAGMNIHTVKSCNAKLPGDTDVVRTILLSYLTAYSRNSNYLAAFNIGDCAEKRLLFFDGSGRPDTVSFADFYRHFIYVITTGNVYKISRQLQVTDTFPVAQICTGHLSGRDVTNFFDDNMWGKCTTTSSHGAFLSLGRNNQFRRLDSDYLPAGSIDDSIAACWNERRQALQFTTPAGKTTYRSYPQVAGLRDIVPLDKERSLLLAENNVFILTHKTLEVRPLTAGIHHFVPQTEAACYTGNILNAKSIAVAGREIYISHLAVRRLELRGDTAFSHAVTKDIGYYYGIETNGPGHTAWIYNDNRLLVYDGGKRLLDIPDDYFRRAGISNIEQVMADQRYGNILIKDRQYLYLFSPATASLQKLFYNYNLKEARCRLYSDRLVIAGRFGVLISKITGRSRFSAPVVYPNIKNTMYLQALGMVVLRDRVLLRTDAGNYELPMPDGDAFAATNSSMPPYRFLAEYNDSVYDLKQQPTICIDQRNDRLLLDIVNPRGNGQVHYCYRLKGTGDEAWHALPNNELRLSLSEPGKTYTLSLAAGDDVWRSNSIDVPVYLVPYWWQTTGWRIVIAIAFAIAFAGLLLLVILLTRHFVSRQNEQKQFLSDLKLRAIYAQINPHFIFNTLNVTQYFIRKKQLDEAYGHISKFSRLLWAYLESARNRYITIAGEVRNIRHYIELQQARFDDLFTYDIFISSELEADTVKIPALLLQPIVENAINHGLVPKESDGHLYIAFEQTGTRGDIIITIDDNGVGRKKAAANDDNPLKKKSYGNELIKELVLLFNRYEKMSINIHYNDKLYPETGTTVTIHIKNPQYDAATHENDQLRNSR